MVSIICCTTFISWSLSVEGWKVPTRAHSTCQLATTWMIGLDHVEATNSMPPKRQRSSDDTTLAMGLGSPLPAADCGNQAKKQKICASEPNGSSMNEEPIDWSESMNIRILKVWNALRRGDVPAEVLKRYNVDEVALRNQEEQYIKEREEDTPALIWSKMKELYHRDIFCTHPNWKAQQLRPWLDDEIKSKNVQPMTAVIHEKIIDKLVKFFSRERDALGQHLIDFAESHHDHKAKAKADKNYLTTKEGRQWLIRAARHIMDPRSTVPNHLTPSNELLDYLEPMLLVIALTPVGKVPDLGQFKSRKKDKSIAKDFMGYKHTQKPVEPKLPAEVKQGKSNANKKGGKSKANASAKKTTGTRTSNRKNSTSGMSVGEDRPASLDESCETVNYDILLSDSDEDEDPIPMRITNNTNAKK